MSYLLSGTPIRSPLSIEETNSTIVAENRTLDGTVTRDYMGSNKRVWKLSYENVKAADFSTINTLYQTFLSTGVALTWQITETNYTVSQTNVHVDLLQRAFTVKGTDYLSDFDLILTEA